MVRMRKVIYVCKEQRDSRYMMARLTVEGWYVLILILALLISSTIMTIVTCRKQCCWHCSLPCRSNFRCQNCYQLHYCFIVISEKRFWSWIVMIIGIYCQKSITMLCCQNHCCCNCREQLFQYYHNKQCHRYNHRSCNVHCRINSHSKK